MARGTVLPGSRNDVCLLMCYAAMGWVLATGQSNECVAGETFRSGETCVECSTSCPSNTYMIRPCTNASNIGCTTCNLCLAEEYLVAACSPDADVSCANKSQMAIVSVTFSGSLAGTIYRRVPGSFREAALKSIRTRMLMLDERRLVNVSTSLEDDNVTLTFSVLPDKVYWDNKCEATGFLRFNGLETFSWINARDADPVGRMSSILLNYFNSSLAMASALQLTLETPPSYMATGTGTFGTFSYSLNVDGARCNEVTSAMVAAEVTSLLPEFKKANPVLFRATTTLVPLTPVLTPSGLTSGALFDQLQEQVSTDNVVATVTEGVVRTTVTATSTSLVAAPAGYNWTTTTTVGPGLAASSESDNEWTLIGIIVGGIIAFILLCAALLWIHHHSNKTSQRVRDMMTVRPRISSSSMSLHPVYNPRGLQLMSPGGSHPAVLSDNMNRGASPQPSPTSRYPVDAADTMSYRNGTYPQGYVDHAPPSPSWSSLSTQHNIRPPAPTGPPPAEPYPSHSGQSSFTPLSDNNLAADGPSMNPSVIGAAALNAHDVDASEWQRRDSIDEAIADDVDTSNMSPNLASAIKMARKASVKAMKAQR